MIGFIRGSVQLICGPMFSGKSTELLRRLRRLELADYSCLLVNYSKDTRYGVMNAVVTHNLESMDALSCNKLHEITSTASNYDVICIDEGQFFPDLVNFSESMANKGKMIIVAALDGTYERKGFANVLDLIPKSESVVRLNAVCMVCKREAAFSKRMSLEREVEVIGGVDKYMSVCRQCYFKQTSAISKDKFPSQEY
eukprot:m.14806 g.14806  ORF g.14806 m.14806 type:complete len:197 (-) comp4374_c0_seq1:918-1508(-)